ncbi:conjugal transfer protein TraN [Sphingomonas solaris]|uniref:Conjugal transfer protein TraN n=2 Tax=Alterirhizorhabdus solaris TaxID=2529389 RepID=A0A558RCA8_9SPHN|nr:conjugal transfer protein TraN [Sphingomonas solaris]TVV76983.1 conjugal transfer protein TraN [Sphingomonas solaris]
MLSLALAGASDVVAQTTIEEARQQGKDMGKAMRADEALMPSDAKVAEVPGYAGTDLPQNVYYDDPDRLVVDGTAQANTDAAYGSVTDRDHSRATFSNAEILSTTSRGTTIVGDPNTYLEGESMGGTSGSCTPLPPASGSNGYYEATCNRGTRIEEGGAVCRTPLVVNVTPGTTKYLYTCENWATTTAQGNNNTSRRCFPTFNAPVASGVCRERSRQTVTYNICRARRSRFCIEPDVEEGDTITYECDTPAVRRAYQTEVTGGVVSEHRDERMCSAATANQTCELSAETCVDPEPSTRTVSGVEVTRACWDWQRTYSCHRTSETSDCADLDGNGLCSYLRDECLDDPQEGACRVSQRVYKCPLPAGPAADKQYVCGGDVYCLNGNCETIEREASTEFKDAVVALHSIGDAGKQFDPNNLTVFSGERDTCHKKIFGAANCCSGKGVPLLTPALCSAAEKKLDEKDDKGLCYKVGSYCSDKVLGVCVTSKDAYCCFGSKLARILQVQGRAQIGKAWGKPKTEQCKGFTIEEFQRLDLSKMDFTEVYAEFTEAAKLPDEVGTLGDIQHKIQGYYDLHGGK